jgi:hypothetical protein
MNVMPDILFELNRMLENEHYAYVSLNEDYEDWSFHDTINCTFDRLDEDKIFVNDFLKRFGGRNSFKYKEIEDIEGYGFSFLIHVIQYVDNTKNTETKKYLPSFVHSEKDLLEYFNEYRYLMIVNKVLHQLDSIREAYEKKTPNSDESRSAVTPSVYISETAGHHVCQRAVLPTYPLSTANR